MHCPDCAEWIASQGRKWLLWKIQQSIGWSLIKIHFKGFFAAMQHPQRYIYYMSYDIIRRKKNTVLHSLNREIMNCAGKILLPRQFLNFSYICLVIEWKSIAKGSKVYLHSHCNLWHYFPTYHFHQNIPQLNLEKNLHLAIDAMQGSHLKIGSLGFVYLFYHMQQIWLKAKSIWS